MSVKVKLTAAEMTQAALIGCMRRITSIYRGRDDHANGQMGRDNNWTTDIYGAAAEMAFAKATKQFFSASVNTFKAPDVGNWQVRSTAHRTGHLHLFEEDNPDARYVLVTCEPPEFSVVGSMIGRDGMVEGYRYRYQRGPELFRIPQSELDEMAEGGSS